jgi:hypothetical protein
LLFQCGAIEQGVFHSIYVDQYTPASSQGRQSIGGDFGAQPCDRNSDLGGGSIQWDKSFRNVLSGFHDRIKARK